MLPRYIIAWMHKQRLSCNRSKTLRYLSRSISLLPHFVLCFRTAVVSAGTKASRSKEQSQEQCSIDFIIALLLPSAGLSYSRAELISGESVFILSTLTLRTKKYQEALEVYRACKQTCRNWELQMLSICLAAFALGRSQQSKPCCPCDFTRSSATWAVLFQCNRDHWTDWTEQDRRKQVLLSSDYHCVLLETPVQPHENSPNSETPHRVRKLVVTWLQSDSQHSQKSTKI